jgi:RNA polymerase sigma factor (sigma-70 family)
VGILDGDLTSLVCASVDGDKDAWNELVRRYASLVAAIIRRYRIAGADVHDVSQLVWLHLIEHLRDVREPAALPGWIVTTTRRECERWLRVKRRSVPLDPDTMNRLGTVDDHADDTLLLAERRQVLVDALTELQPPQRELLQLLLADPPYTYAQISHILRIPIGSIGPTRNRILDKLRNTAAVKNYLRANGEAAQMGGGRHAFAGLE